MRIVIAEDEVLLRQGLALVLEQGGFEVVDAVTNADELLRRTAELRPDLVLTDIRMPPGYSDEGLVAALEIRRTIPETAVVVLSQYVQRRYAIELLSEHPSKVGYLLKQRIADVPTFYTDIQRVCDGGTVLDPEVVSMMVRRARHEDEAIERLTARQCEVLTLMAQGRTNAAIARELSITEKAVVQHASHIYEDLGLTVGEKNHHRRVVAVLRYLSR
jgi:DNA-binding NarL/FixJ family response regulator